MSWFPRMVVSTSADAPPTIRRCGGLIEPRPCARTLTTTRAFRDNRPTSSLVGARRARRQQEEVDEPLSAPAACRANAASAVATIV